MTRAHEDLNNIEIGVALKDEVTPGKMRCARIRQVAHDIYGSKCGRIATLTLSTIVGMMIYILAHYTGEINMRQKMCNSGANFTNDIITQF